MSDPFGHLARLRASLQEGLALFDDAPADDPSVPEALGRILAALKDAPDPAALRAAVPAARLEEFDDQIEELLRLNAVLARAAASDRDALLGRLKSVRASRRDLAYYGSDGAASGGRCDMSA